MLCDVRVNPRGFKPSDVQCTYRGARWNNVLDHLVIWKANPNAEKCLASQAERRARNIKVIQCSECDHKPFTKLNTYIQHMGRKHPLARQLNSILATAEQLPPDRFTTSAIAMPEVHYESVGDLAWLSADCGELAFDSSPDVKRTRLYRHATDELDCIPLLDQAVASMSPLQDEMEAFTSSKLSTSTELALSAVFAPNDARLEELDTSATSHSPIDDHEMCIGQVSHNSPSVDESNTPEVCRLVPLTEEASYRAVSSMLEAITKADIRQPAGRTEHNASEISVDGVTQLLNTFGDVEPSDAFADIGSGVGNVSIQVALQIWFTASVCVEMRPELTRLAERIVAEWVHAEARLAKLAIITADISETNLVGIPAMMSVSHIFSHNTLFSANALLKLEHLCWLPELRCIALTKLPCTRHRDRCENLFCKTWTIHAVIRVPVAYKVARVDVFIFTRSLSALSIIYRSGPCQDVECRVVVQGNATCHPEYILDTNTS